MNEPREGAVRRGEVLTLQQRSVRRRGYGLRRGDQDLGRLLSVVGGFLALRELQAGVDASAAVGGIVAAGAG